MPSKLRVDATLTRTAEELANGASSTSIAPPSLSIFTLPCAIIDNAFPELISAFIPSVVAAEFANLTSTLPLGAARKTLLVLCKTARNAAVLRPSSRATVRSRPLAVSDIMPPRTAKDCTSMSSSSLMLTLSYAVPSRIRTAVRRSTLPPL